MQNRIHVFMVCGLSALISANVFGFSTASCAKYAVKADNVCDATRHCVDRFMVDLEQRSGGDLSGLDRIQYLVDRAHAHVYREETIYKGVKDINKAYELLHAIEAETDKVRELKQRALYLRAAFALRLGELRNCINNHNADSCIVPLSKNAQHSEEYGSRLAIESLLEYMELYGRNAHMEWLLNLAYQTLGEYPDKVPEEYRLPPEVFTSQTDIGRFVDVAGPLGLQRNSMEAGGVAVEDISGNGHLDIMIASLGFCDPVLYFENQGDGRFVDRTTDAGFGGLTNQGAIQPVDYNNNGFVDVYFASGGWEGPVYRKHLPQKYNYLYENNGQGRFVDVTEKVGLRTGRNHTLGSAWQDFTNNGWLDLIVCNEYGEVELFVNKKGKFTKMDVQLGNPEKRCKSAAWGDINNNGWPDLYLSYHDHHNYLYRNINGEEFIPVTDSIVTKPESGSFVAWFFDYNNNGWEDLFVASFQGLVEFGEYIQGQTFQTATMKLYQNTGDGRFRDVTEETGLAFPATTMGVNYGDINNDGYPDIYLGTGGPTFDQLEPNRLLLNNNGKRFVGITYSAGVGNLQKGHGIAFADINNNGQQDIMAQFGGAFPGDKFFPSLYKNPGNNKNWITLRLEGVKANRSAIGARIRVDINENGKQRSVYHTVGHGGSFGSNPLQAQIGLGQADHIERISIQWRGDLAPEEFTDIPVNAIYNVKEGTGRMIKSDVKTVHDFGEGTHRHHHHH